MKNRIKAALLMIVIQTIMAGIFFIGFILDPLIGISIAGIYFALIGSFFIYHFFARRLLS